MDDFKQSFRDEAFELLAALENSLLELERAPTDRDAIAKVFRAMHTIKGSGAMFGFDAVSQFTHEVETVFDAVRQGRATVEKRLISLTLQCRDHIRVLFEADYGGPAPDVTETRRLVTELRAYLAAQTGVGALPTVDPKGTPTGAKTANQSTPTEEGVDPKTARTYRVQFRPRPDILSTGTNPLLLMRELRELGQCRVKAMLDGMPPFAGLDPQTCYLWWDVVLTTSRGENAIRDVFIFVEDLAEITILELDGPDLVEPSNPRPRLGEILVDRGAVAPAVIEQILAAKPPLGEQLVRSGAISTDQVDAALAEQNQVAEARRARAQAEGASSVRVPAERLDHLVNLIGELVTVQARLSALSQKRADSELTSVSEVVERLTNELRDTALNIRMLPIGTTFSKFRRLVRDLANELGKEVEMTTEGAETELDKTVIEKLNDPMVHLIRNAIDHGIEMPEERVAKGKTRQGTVHLAACHAGANVLIKITDDGAGLDREAIRQKAVERGIIAATADLSDKDVYGLILQPGFSTAKQVTSVSGRGVGMDVVKRSIDELRGSLEIASVAPNQGTQITVRLPLTLAIIDGLLVAVADRFFVLPLSIVHECVELTALDLDRSHGRNVTIVRGEIVPYIRLRERFAIEGEAPPLEQIVIVVIEGMKVGFVVDFVVGQHQTVIKSLSRFYRDVEGITGATILGDGAVALIIDAGRLARQEEQDERARVDGQGGV